MAIDIQYKDFDTVAYSYRHNIEQLIKASVGLSVEVNISIDMAGAAQAAADAANQAVTDLDNKLHTGGGAGGSDAGGELGIMQSLIDSQARLIQELTKRIESLENFDYNCRNNTVIGRQIVSIYKEVFPDSSLYP